MPDSSTEYCSFYYRIFKTIKETTEIVYNAFHNCFIFFRCCRYKIKFFVFHFCIRTAATIYQCFHLCTHCIEIDRSCHNNDISLQHLSDNLSRIIFLWTRFFMQATDAASKTRVNRLITQENLFYMISTFYCSTHKLITKRIGITSTTWTR